MFARISKWVTVIVLTAVLGAHWVLLQSIAWVSMTAEFTRSMPLSTAVSKVFSGEASCKLCKWVAEAKHAEKERASETNVPRLDLFFVRASVVLYPPSAAELPCMTRRFHSAIPESPPVPPPRFV